MDIAEKLQQTSSSGCHIHCTQDVIEHVSAQSLASLCVQQTATKLRERDTFVVSRSLHDLSVLDLSTQ